MPLFRASSCQFVGLRGGAVAAEGPESSTSTRKLVLRASRTHIFMRHTNALVRFRALSANFGERDAGRPSLLALWGLLSRDPPPRPQMYKSRCWPPTCVCMYGRWGCRNMTPATAPSGVRLLLERRPRAACAPVARSSAAARASPWRRPGAVLSAPLKRGGAPPQLLRAGCATSCDGGGRPARRSSARPRDRPLLSSPPPPLEDCWPKRAPPHRPRGARLPTAALRYSAPESSSLRLSALLNQRSGMVIVQPRGSGGGLPTSKSAAVGRIWPKSG